MSRKDTAKRRFRGLQGQIKQHLESGDFEMAFHAIANASTSLNAGQVVDLVRTINRIGGTSGTQVELEIEATEDPQESIKIERAYKGGLWVNGNPCGTFFVDPVVRRSIDLANIGMPGRFNDVYVVWNDPPRPNVPTPPVNKPKPRPEETADRFAMLEIEEGEHPTRVVEDHGLDDRFAMLEID